MKLSSKEMIILAVFLSIAIIVAGLFLFIMPEYEKIQPNKNSLQAAKDERDQVYASLAREATIDKEIDDAIELANTVSLNFYEDMTTYEADVLVREILEATDMSTDSLSLGSFSTATLTVSDFVETIISYPLKEYSGFQPNILNTEDYPVEYDEDGDLIVPDAYIEKYGEEQALTEYLTALLSTQSQTIGAITVNFTVTGTRGDFLNFLNYIADLEKATIINNTTVAYTGFENDGNTNNNNNNNNNAAPVEGEEGEAAQNVNTNTNTNTTPTEQLLNDNSEISAPISMTFFCVTPMAQVEITTSAEVEAEPAA